MSKMTKLSSSRIQLVKAQAHVFSLFSKRVELELDKARLVYSPIMQVCSPPLKKKKNYNSK